MDNAGQPTASPFAPPGADERQGRLIVVVVEIALLSTAIVVTAWFVVVRGPERILAQGVRFALTCGLAYALVRGAPWSRWVAILLFAPVGLISCINGFQSTDGPHLGLILLGAVYLACGALLAFPRSVRRFFARAA